MGYMDYAVKTRPNRWVWVAYDHKPPYLPKCVASSSEELARICGVKRNSIQSNWSKYQRGILKHARYARVYIPEDAE